MKLKTLKDIKKENYQIHDKDRDKLKTLKDLGREYAASTSKGVILHRVNVEELKQEIIQWVREFQIERTRAISEMFDNVDKYGIYPTTKFFNRIDEFWMKKFNLTEEDLK